MNYPLAEAIRLAKTDTWKFALLGDSEYFAIPVLELGFVGIPKTLTVRDDVMSTNIMQRVAMLYWEQATSGILFLMGDNPGPFAGVCYIPSASDLRSSVSIVPKALDEQFDVSAAVEDEAFTVGAPSSKAAYQSWCSCGVIIRKGAPIYRVSDDRTWVCGMCYVREMTAEQRAKSIKLDKDGNRKLRPEPGTDRVIELE